MGFERIGKEGREKREIGAAEDMWEEKLSRDGKGTGGVGRDIKIYVLYY